MGIKVKVVSTSAALPSRSVGPAASWILPPPSAARMLPRRRSAARAHGPSCAARLQVPAPQIEQQPGNLFTKICKAAVLIPALGLAFFSCGNAHARAPSVTPTKISTTRSVSSSRPQQTPFASASAAMGDPTVRAAVLAVCLVASISVATTRSFSRRRVESKPTALPKIRKDSLFQEEKPQKDMAQEELTQEVKEKKKKDSLPDPGVIVLGLAGLMIDSLSASTSSRKKGSIKAGPSVVEAEPTETERESDAVARRSETMEEDIKVVQKYDLFVELVEAGNNVMTDTKYDPIRSMFIEASTNVSSFAKSFLNSIEWQGDDRYDLIKDLFQRLKAEGILSTPKYDPLCAALAIEVPTGVGMLDPVGGIMRTAKKPVQFVGNKFDMLSRFLEGSWQSDVESLEKIPKWDVMSAVHASAGRPLEFEENKYDPKPALLQPPKSQIPKWDPVIGFLRSMNTTNPSSQDKAKYDPVAAALHGSWVADNSTLATIPEWDPTKGIHKGAKEPASFDENRYDVAESLLKGDWQNEVSSVGNLPRWDPVSGMVGAARSSAGLVSNKFDMIASLLDGEWQAEAQAPAAQSRVTSSSAGGVKSEEEASGASKFDAIPSLLRGDWQKAWGGVEDQAPEDGEEKLVGMAAAGFEAGAAFEADPESEAAAEEAAAAEAAAAEAAAAEAAAAEAAAAAAAARVAAEEKAKEAEMAAQAEAERLMIAKMEEENARMEEEKTRQAKEMKSSLLKSIVGLIREFESGQKMDVIQAEGK